MDFIGEKCAACHEVFTADDDIVVCPDCGSPHHRDCYLKEKKCANADKHLSGYKWTRNNSSGSESTAEKTSEISVRVCPVCKFPNQPESERCVRCGARLEDASAENDIPQENYEMPRQYGPNAYPGMDNALSFLGFDPNEDMGGSTLSEVSHFVGSNTIYYIPLFKRMKDLGKKFSFNVVCLLFPEFYFANRKMWFWALLVGIIKIILGVPSVALEFLDRWGERDEFSFILDTVSRNKDFIVQLQDACSTIDWVINIIFCLLGNWLYFRYVLKNLDKLHERGVDGKSDPALLTSAGGVKHTNILIMLALNLLLSPILLYLMVSILK